MNNELYHHGIKGMKWGVRRFQTKNGILTSAGKKRYSNSDAGKNPRKPNKSTSKRNEKIFNTLKEGANRALDKADRDNFFNSDSIFSEKSMKRQSQIDRARDVINNLDYKTLTSPKGAKHLVNTGKQALRDALDDADDRSFFNDDWDTRMKKQDRNDFLRDLLDD